ncbi:VWA domain-containing protein [Haloarcula sp. H-GB4]|uniref:VWA domain-containing protein n=1 Tax=Haloarcula sp. H-GB4 TaxID=3069755 RepID=UPI0027B673D2|nr:VWA domain-containing protein [Haloarcula sp. H-GB4]MDQ2074807.1 VWA domain-containing protein [Haloarcula sp. H-GB4]
MTVGPASGMMAGAGAGPLQTAGNDASLTGAGNQTVTTAGNEPTRTQPQTPTATAGNQATGPLSTSWNDSTEPNASEIEQLAPRENNSHPYPLVGEHQPTDPDGDGLYEDVNGDGAVNIVDVDALSRHLGTTAAGANWSSYDYTGDNRTDVGDIQWLLAASLSTASNDTDGDGLPDAYERNVTETDPVIADSDGDAVIDGAEDWDNDTLPAYREYRLGTDPRSNDTDGDRLSDGIESRLPSVDPTDPDTDDDGVQDGAADPDNDSLNTYNETLEGTLSTNSDTDGDGLLDGTEVHQLGTDPLAADTDGDGLLDGEEVRLGTDPLVADSDDNGVIDGKESYTTTATNETLGVTLSLTGNGDVGNGTTIAPQDDPRFNTSRVANMSASPVVELDSEQDFSSANVTLAYNETGAQNESQDLAVFTYDPEAGIFVPLNSTVDAANNTVTAETSHFSTFAVFDITNWAATYNATEPVRQTDDDGVQPVEVVMLLDASGSMESEDPKRLAKDAAQRFTGSLLETDRAAVIEFDNFGRVKQPLTSNHTAVNRSIRDVEYEGGNGGTDFASISAANEHFAEQSSPDRAKIIIFLTDGKSKYSDGVTEAEQAAEQNITIYPIGFGGATRDQLSAIANATGGEVNFVDNAGGLPTVFSRVANTTTEINDTDGDGLSDEMEREGFILGGPSGDRVTTDPTSNDTDGDGLSDSREVGQYAEVTYRGETASYYNHVANPRQVDTDGDGISDTREVRNTTIVTFDSKTEANALREAMVTDNQSLNLQAAGTVLNVTSSALNPDTDGDGISDAEEWRYRTNPRQVDTDNDGISDTTEVHDDLDPTLYDIRGPVIKSLRTDSYNPGWAGPHYVLDFRVRDRSGLGTVRIAQRGNETLDRANFTGHTQYHYSQDLTGNALQSAGTFAGGTEVYIYAYDSHGNKRHVRALTRSNNIVNNLQGHYDAIGPVEAKTFGRGSGLMHGAGEFGSTVSNPVETAAGLSQVPNALANYGRTYESMETQFKNRQRVNNPFPPNTPENESFARGYFDGYMGFLVIEELTGTAALKTVKESSRVARTINRIDNTRYLGKSVTAARKLKYASELPARGVGRVAAFGVDQAKRPFARYSLRNSRTVGKVVRTRRYVADKTPQKVYDLNTKQRKLSARYFRDADLGGRSPSELETAGKLMAENNPKQVSRMLRRMDDGQQAAFLSDDLDEATRADLYKAWKNGDNVGASDVAEATSADPQTVRLIADGSGDVDDAYDRAIIRAANSDSIDSNKQLHRVVRKVDDLDATRQRRAKQLIAETDGAGIKLVDELDTTQLRTAMDAVDSTDGLSRLSRQFDAGTVEGRHIDEITDLLDSGDMDGADLRRFSKMLHQRGSDPLIDDSIDADDLLDVAQKGELSETRLVTKDRDGEPIRLQSGDTDSGLEHIEGRHVNGDIVRRQQANGKDSGAASFFPTGRKIEVDGKTNKLPDKMNGKDVKELIYETVEEGSKDAGRGDRIQYTLKPSDHGHDYGIERMKVIVKDDGSIHTAYPKSGGSVEKWSFPAGDWV